MAQETLERLIVDHIEHYTEHRPHRTLDQRSPLLAGLLNHAGGRPRVLKSTRCHGLIDEYPSTTTGNRNPITAYIMKTLSTSPEK